MKITVKAKSTTVGSIKKTNPLSPGIVLCSVASDAAKNNYNLTLRGDFGFWTVPKGSNGDKVIVGDDYWFRDGVNDLPNRGANCIRSVWVVQETIEVDTPAHNAICELWEREEKWDTPESSYRTRRIVVLARKRSIKNQDMTYQELIDLVCKDGATKLPVQDVRIV
jgi:hypothetical protein